MIKNKPIFSDVLDACSYARRMGWDCYIIERIPQGYTVENRNWSEEDDDRK